MKKFINAYETACTTAKKEAEERKLRNDKYMKKAVEKTAEYISRIYDEKDDSSLFVDFYVDRNATGLDRKCDFDFAEGIYKEIMKDNELSPLYTFNNEEYNDESKSKMIYKAFRDMIRENDPEFYDHFFNCYDIKIEYTKGVIMTEIINR